MNHNVNANKMVSDTPRTDAEYDRLLEINQEWERISGPLCCPFDNDMRLCRQLERELNAANAKIQRLQEAGDELSYRLRLKDESDSDAYLEWIKAKEAKP